MNKKRLRWPLQIPSLPQSTRDEYSSQGWRELREDVSCSVSPRPLPHLHHQLSIQATYELLRRLPQATFWAPIPLLLIWFISFSFFSGNNWCVWPWRESNIRTADSCGYPGNIKWLKWGTSGNNNPSPYIPILCSMMCLTPCEFYLGELGHDISTPWCFGRTGLILPGGVDR